MKTAGTGNSRNTVDSAYRQQVSGDAAFVALPAVGRLVLGNGPGPDFSAPPDTHGHAGVLTPEDAFVAAANTCVMLMFLWACERFKLDLVSYHCRTDGTKRVEMDRTESFTHLHFWPEIVVRGAAGEEGILTEQRVRKALARLSRC